MIAETALLVALRVEIERYWPEQTMRWPFATQVEIESAWRENARLKTSREEGCGFGQITRTARFDTLAELKDKHADAFSGWSWDNCTNRTYQLRSVVIMNLDAARALPRMANAREQWAMIAAARNRGVGGTVSEWRLCQRTPGCDASRWYGHIELTCTASRAPLPGIGRSACEVNRAHVAKVMDEKRGAKYVQALK